MSSDIFVSNVNSAFLTITHLPAGRVVGRFDKYFSYKESVKKKFPLNRQKNCKFVRRLL